MEARAVVASVGISITLTAALSWLPAQAAQPSYTHIGLSYVNLDSHDRHIDGDGPRVDGSIAVHPKINLLGSFTQWNLDGRTERQDIQLGVGLHTPVRPNLDVEGQVFYENRDYHHGPRNNDGLGLRGGLRGIVGDRYELRAGLIARDMKRNSDLGVYGGAWYSIAGPISIGADLEVTDEQRIFGLGGRYNF